MPRVISSTVIRARTGCIGLKAWLGLRGLADSRQCECGEGVEDVKYLVFSCPKFRGFEGENLGNRTPVSMSEELSEADKAIKIARFLIRTGALGQLGRAEKATRDLLEGPED